MRSNAVCLNYQSVYCSKQESVNSFSAIIAAAIILFLALCMKIWLSITLKSLGYQLAEERDKTIALDMQRREYELQLSVLLRPDNLEERAKNVLGLRALRPEQAAKISY